MGIKAVSLSKIVERLKRDKKLLIICFIGIIGIILLLLSEIVPSIDEGEGTHEIEAKTQSELSYAEDIESRLTQIISSIDGAGDTKVMVTLENGTEQVYAQNEKSSSDNTSNTDETQSDFSFEKEYVLIESNSNGEDGLVIKLIQPKIRGVAVVCEGGGSDIIRQEISETVTAVLDISASRVYVTKMTS
ncbi:MAG: hypothetical protein IJN85_03720 [Oscillospiraceae bacterium]|nr:hypothetical protein [Oscillospiraceae bacterium]